MRNYWLKILAGAFGIFAVGMVIITGIRSVKSKVTSTLNSTDPIPIPLIGLVPFRVDSARLGSLSRVELLRDTPEHLSGVRVVVRLADSLTPDRLRSCVLVVDDVNKVDERTTFRCQALDAAPAGLENFGTVVVKGFPDTFPLMLPARAVAELRRTEIKVTRHGVHVNTPPDPARVRLEERVASMTTELETRVEARADSVESLRGLADELEDSAAALPPGPRRLVQRSADSVRARMRLVQDRRNLDQTRLEALGAMHDLSPEEVDSLARMGQRIADSVRANVARELQRVARELERVGAPATGTGAPAAGVEAPAIPPPPPVGAPRP